MATPIQFCERAATNHPRPDHWSVAPGVETIKKATVLKDGALPVPCDILWEKHLPITLRDGVTVYVDVYRPPNARPGSVPAILSAGPYGKNGGYYNEFTNKAPFRFGIPQKTVSGLEKFEGLDPAFWCFYDYAIVHLDPRGVQWSEGDMHFSGEEDGRDNYDVIEWIAAQPWCNKRVSMAGNSWLSQVQWFTAAEKPPHLTCIAPAEGWTDFYNDTVNRGGIPNPYIWQWISQTATRGQSKVEDTVATVEKYPFWNDFWERRKAKLENIEIPALIVASWTGVLHAGGTFHGWLGIKSRDKWLRVHNSNEWPDLYRAENVMELKSFYDRYLKGEDNHWEFTPKVQLCVLNPGGKDIINRPEADFPLARAQTTLLHLDASNSSLSRDSPVAAATRALVLGGANTVDFAYTFKARTELTGYFALKLFVSAHEALDFDVFGVWNKVSAEGRVLRHLEIDPGYMQDDPAAVRQGYLSNEHPPLAPIFLVGGSHGRLRMSHRELAPGSTISDPRYTQRAGQPALEKGEVAEIHLELRPYGVIFEAGETLRLSISGQDTRPELPFLKQPEPISDGKFYLHTGGQHQSALVVPWIG